MTVAYVSKDDEHDPGGELEPRKYCPGQGGHYEGISNFYPDRTKGGLRSLCRKCELEKGRAKSRDENGRTLRERKVFERRELIRPFAEQGFTAPEIAEKLDHRWSQHTIQSDVRSMGLGRKANGYPGQAPVSIIKQIEAATTALAGIAHQLDQLQLHDVVFDDEQARSWEKELTNSAYSINRVRRQLRKGTPRDDD